MKKRDILKKSILVGIGIGALTKEKVERYVNRLKREGYLDAAAGKRLAKDMLSEGKKLETKLKAHVKKRIRLVRKLKSRYYAKKKTNIKKKRVLNKRSSKKRVVARSKQPKKKNKSKKQRR